jgi:hypothetical protein
VNDFCLFSLMLVLFHLASIKINVLMNRVALDSLVQYVMLCILVEGKNGKNKTQSFRHVLFRPNYGKSYEVLQEHT